MRMGEGQWDAVIAVNLKSAFNFIHACTPIMMRQRSGNIINMASVVGVHGNAGQCNYSASKAGLIGLAKSIAQELGSRGIRANAIAPGFIITDMTAKLSDEVKEEWSKKIPLRRGGTPEDVANIALFLASDLSSYVSGQVIQVDGGINDDTLETVMRAGANLMVAGSWVFKGDVAANVRHITEKIHNIKKELD